MQLSVPGSTGHSHVLDAVRQLLADGKPHSPAELCAQGIAAKLLPAGTIPKYVLHAITAEMDRERLAGGRPAFQELPDGTFRLNVPSDPFPAFHRSLRTDGRADALVERLRATARRKTPPEPQDGTNIGAPFERAVTDALTLLGFVALHDGRAGEPDVVATAPLGSTAYTVVFECKSVDSAKVGAHGLEARNAQPVEAARFRDRLGAQYAVLIGPGFPGDRALDEELATHGVALWDVEDFVALIQAFVQHPIAWASLRPLFAPGRASDAIACFASEHRYGSRERALVAFRYAMEEGLTYQRSLVTGGPPADAPLTAEALTMLVNERLANENDTARLSVEDIRAAVQLGVHPAIAFMTDDTTGIHIEVAL
jgi:hypothetical protein